MCQPTRTSAPTNSNPASKNIIIAGAGPSGILAAINFLRRNKDSDVKSNYHVTVIDANQDYGKLSPTELKKHRSWMIGLASHGLEAIRDVPGLYEEYVSEVGIELKSVSIHLGTKEIKQETDDVKGQEGYIVDRNYIVATMARYLNDKYLSNPCFKSMYDTSVLYVDGNNKRVLVRNADMSEEYISYDLLIGCDGIRSVVRNAILQNHRDFNFSIDDIFTDFKAVHVTRPESVDAASMHLLPGSIPESLGIGLPETGDKLNISIGYYNNKVVPEEMKSKDAKVVAKYMKEHFKAFTLVDYDDFANQWVNQSWNTTGQVHCNFYHSSKISAVIMGDAAHATSPSIGMGMNTALSDAFAFNELLKKHKDDLDVVLPEFSNERVKEGNALTNLAYYLYAISERQAMMNIVCQIVRTKLAKWFPGWVLEDPQAMLGRRGVKLSEVYDVSTQLGIVPAVRVENDRVKREYFERKTGMVTHKKSILSTSMKKTYILLAGILAASVYLYRC